MRVLTPLYLAVVCQSARQYGMLRVYSSPRMPNRRPSASRPLMFAAQSDIPGVAGPCCFSQG